MKTPEQSGVFFGTQDISRYGFSVRWGTVQGNDDFDGFL